MNTDLQVVPLIKKNQNSKKKFITRNPLFGNLVKTPNTPKNKTRKRKAIVINNNQNIMVGNNKILKKENNSGNITVGDNTYGGIGELPQETESSEKINQPIEKINQPIESTNEQDFQIIQSNLDYNPFYQRKFTTNMKKPTNITHNSNALLLLSKIKDDPSKYLSTKMIEDSIKNVPEKHIKLTNDQLKQQSQIARDFV